FQRMAALGVACTVQNTPDQTPINVIELAARA
ncbi:PTS N-acetylgalactosamine transporter subunit IIB, partial [Salmonella enterica subsp. enterica serovar Dublin]|nr:PTS N-acetylgalactosamine transporter subunit IIB [Salmonella enterica subsp. enterica serovar Dublin]